MSETPVKLALSPMLSRRLALGGAVLGGLGLTAAAARRGQDAMGEAPAAAPSGMCILTPQVTQGPYWIDPKLERSDITEGRPGVPLDLAITVLDAATCRPFERARVDIWQCDAQGVYSGFANQPGYGSTEGQTFLRGHVFTDAAGVARFNTIYPGWYSGRTTHIHVKVFLDDGGESNLLTCQLFFPDALSEFIFANDPNYRREQVRDTLNRHDDIAQEQGYGNFGAVSEQADRYAMTVTLGVDRAARSRQETMGPPPGGPREGGRPPGPPPEGMGGPRRVVLTDEERIQALIPHKD